MTDHIWFGGFRALAFNKVGLRHKFFGKAWEEPYKNHIVPRRDDEFMQAMKRYNQGKLLKREELTECSAVYDQKCWSEQKEFSIAGVGYIVDERVAEVLSDFDIGPGGMFPYPIYQADEETRITDRWQMLGLGAQKRSFQGDLSKHEFVECLVDGKGERDSIYMIGAPVEDDVLVASSAALQGADLWMEPELLDMFGFSDRLAQALKEAGLARWFDLQRARIVD
jgi:hypothetical protein